MTPPILLPPLRTNLPAIFSSRPPIKPPLSPHPKPLTLSSIFQPLPPFKQPSITKQQFLHIQQNPSPTSPSSTPIFTPNSINSLIQLLPLPLPYNPTPLALTHQRRKIITQAAFQ
ncbi:dihydroxy-acid dehydratase domain-containing protein, partial [Staphylococcus hominis]|uniref:dihydroxy-acid dehydratase domain-containing protein n=1 Tax=Staphylococcus hominis TaxID=1290 RepID=UPI0037094B37